MAEVEEALPPSGLETTMMMKVKTTKWSRNQARNQPSRRCPTTATDPLISLQMTEMAPTRITTRHPTVYVVKQVMAK
jgi:hypothetical protein